MDSKRWYHSKTLWTNVLAITVLILESQFSRTLTPEMQVTILGVINIVLRLITNQGLTK